MLEEFQSINPAPEIEKIPATVPVITEDKLSAAEQPQVKSDSEAQIVHIYVKSHPKSS